MSARQLLALSVVVIATLASACSGRMRGGVRYAGPITSSDLERGHTRFHVVCAPCHEGHLIAEAPSLAHLGWRPDQVRRQVREGTALMPPIRVERLSAGDLEALLAYLVSIAIVVEPLDDGEETAPGGDAEESWADYLDIEEGAAAATPVEARPVEPAPVEPAPVIATTPTAPAPAEPPEEPAPAVDPAAAAPE